MSNQTLKNLEITLFGIVTSPYVQKVATYLAYKQIPFRFVNVNPISKAEIAFSKQPKVPVLKVNDSWKTESSDIGWWLEEEFPSPSMSIESQKDTIKVIDHWVSHTVIPSLLFRPAVDWINVATGLFAGWRLARIIHSSQTLPYWAQIAWPFIIKKAPFIHRIVQEDVDTEETREDMRVRLAREFELRLGNGPFLGELNNPTLADLSLFGAFFQTALTVPPAFVKNGFLQVIPPSKAFLPWMIRVSESLPYPPLLSSPKFTNKKALSLFEFNRNPP